MPRIESGRWRPYPSHLHRSSASHSMDGADSEGHARANTYLYATTLDAKQRFQSGFLHQLPQVGSIGTHVLWSSSHTLCGRFVVVPAWLQQLNDHSFCLVSTV
jgi:hypothetical protein